MKDHLDRATPPSAPTSSDKDKDKGPTSPPIDMDLWVRLDVIVLQWIYGTISNDLLHTNLETDSTAHQAWLRLKIIFQGNKHSRAVYPENQLINTRLDNFSNVFAYCQELKMLADQLSNVGALVSNNHLVLRFIVGLNDNYDGIATLTQQTDPVPEIYEVRSKLTRKTKQALANGNTSDASFLSTADDQKNMNATTLYHTCNTNTPNKSTRDRDSSSNRGSYTKVFFSFLFLIEKNIVR